MQSSCLESDILFLLDPCISLHTENVGFFPQREMIADIENDNHYSNDGRIKKGYFLANKRLCQQPYNPCGKPPQGAGCTIEVK